MRHAGNWRFKTLPWKVPEFDARYPMELDWAQMASFIDGEGSVCINTAHSKAGPTFYLLITVANTDVRLMEWISFRFGGSYVRANTGKYYEGRNVKDSWHWTTSGNRAAWILFNCMPYFVIKKEQAEIGIRLQESMDEFSPKFYRTGLPPELRNKRKELKRKLLVMKMRGVEPSAEHLKRIEEVS